MRSVIYIDGFNLYYGLVKDTPWKWLNIEDYFTRIFHGDSIQAIKYFTAVADNSQDQATYLNALDTLPNVKIIYGKFKDVNVECKVSNCRYRGNRIFKKKEEKRTDVNIAIHILNDACSNQCDKLVLVSGDSDLVPALTMIKRLVPTKRLVVYVPAPRKHHIRAAAVELRGAADKSKTLFPTKLLSVCQFPQVITTATANTIAKPPTW